ncbi:flagellar hook-associated protein FlgL [Ferrimonas marina]|uniref:Flagellar hook-associated protein 3 FlgL n=1 Tax=Ferrimonas marina TaxID=299255 RepID=A0A1M5R076_9GAMM|nr:flagellar hook-associated protein FlgL [Ferrimonas marina]SHH19379.1 flagellar hook-associated protein 3 FlgL [Ferrimonas marina]
MRVSSQQMHRTNMISMQQNATNYGKVLQQMSTGKRINVASDDPLGAVQTLSLKREQASLSQYIDNISSLRMSLARSESNLDNMNNVMYRMRDLTLQAFNGSNGPEERAGIAAELRVLRDSLVDYANAKDEQGKYIYAGHEVDTPPIGIDANGNYVYQGDDGIRDIPVGDGNYVQGNDTANQIFFSGAADIFNKMEEWITMLEDPTLDPNDPAFHALFDETLDSIDQTMASIGGLMTDIGGRQNAMDLMETAHQDVGLFNQELIGLVEDLDYAEASLELTTYLLALQATQQSYAQINQMSLFNHI